MFKQFLIHLYQLKENDKPLWGKMSAQHMVEHLILAVKMSNGKLRLKCFSPSEKIPALKRFLMSSRPLPKMFESPALGNELPALQFKTLNEAKDKLEEEIEDYYNFFRKNPDVKTVNVTFGELNKDEWDFFHTKHFKHHLSQFGLLKFN
jgi:oxepin-CoA hydrolase/3-oxo-5,6-dehydrosuberyl-CoA semialdehyde dehydrogenase